MHPVLFVPLCACGGSCCRPAFVASVGHIVTVTVVTGAARCVVRGRVGVGLPNLCHPPHVEPTKNKMLKLANPGPVLLSERRWRGVTAWQR